MNINLILKIYIQFYQIYLKKQINNKFANIYIFNVDLT